MSKIFVSVIFPVEVEIEFDENKNDDMDYIYEKQEEAKDIASNIIETSTIKPYIHNSSCPDMIE
jgi:hypothetical protein